MCIFIETAISECRSRIIIQVEHKITPWLQVVIKSKLTGIFLQIWDCRYCTGISLSSRFSTSTCQTDGLAALDKMTRCSTSGHRDHRTWPFVTFSFGGTWRTESMYLHYPRPWMSEIWRKKEPKAWMSCRNAPLQLSIRSSQICSRESGPS